MATKVADNVLKFEPVAIDGAAAIHSIRLVECEDQVQLLTATTRPRGGSVFPQHETVIHTIALDAAAGAGGRPKVLLTMPQLLPPPPRWDAAISGDGTAAICAESAGGALNSIFIQTVKGGTQSVTGKYPLNSFSHPRLVKHRRVPTDATLSTIVDDKELVVFPGRLSAPYGEYRKAVLAIDGLMVENPQGYHLFYKTSMPGPSRGDLPQGEIHVGEMARGIAAPANTESPMRSKAIYEFDADVVGEYLAMLVTTPGDLLLSRRLATGGSFKPVRIEGLYDASQLFSPCILATSNEVFLAVLEAPGSPRARILVARGPLDAVK